MNFDSFPSLPMNPSLHCTGIHVRDEVDPAGEVSFNGTLTKILISNERKLGCIYKRDNSWCCSTLFARNISWYVSLFVWCFLQRDIKHISGAINSNGSVYVKFSTNLRYISSYRVQEQYLSIQYRSYIITCKKKSILYDSVVKWR